MKWAHSPITRIRMIGGSGRARSAMGQKAMADSAMPVKKIAERIQSVIVMWPKAVEFRRELAGGDNGCVGKGGHALFVHASQQVVNKGCQMGIGQAPLVKRFLLARWAGALDEYG